MKKLTGFCFFWLMISTPVLYAQSDNNKLLFNITDGYQCESFHWSIAGNSNGQNPNVFSELKWTKLSGQSIGASLQWNVYQKFSVYADYTRQFITSGSVKDSDYSGDNRTGNTYNETFNAGKGHTQGWSLGIGYQLINNNWLKLTPYAGYSDNRQSLYLYDDANRFPGLNSSYQTKWKGAFIKAIASFKLIEKLRFNSDITYNQVSYNALGNWNLITTFQHPVSYHHHANGYGLNMNGTLAYSISKLIAIQAGGGYLHWQTGNGTDELYLSSGEVDKTQMNGAFRNGFKVFGGVIVSL
ncbi:hypothetical protein [Mucilaginibacter rubeus]|uniref:Protochlamydia outer membrane protein domain-containing protein n=1 Tax=Mucilaginibacter rubeus TaxID=2027860 RepID=A0A5C1I6Q9_9SPHI|nr:hypothetical protein [Mucilaginibacter rubeus]QEM13198.1 hypothetical protein DEO27_025380 [Mucilaginibacter rubeus]